MGEKKGEFSRYCKVPIIGKRGGGDFCGIRGLVGDFWWSRRSESRGGMGPF